MRPSVLWPCCPCAAAATRLGCPERSGLPAISALHCCSPISLLASTCLARHPPPRRDVTHKGTGPDGRRPEASAWTQAALNRMLERRDAAWAAACGRGAIPAWLAAWVTYCKRLPAAAAPDYAYLRRLIGEGERQAATAAAAAAKAAGAHGWGAAWGAAEE